jgi:hypothetical protein
MSNLTSPVEDIYKQAKRARVSAWIVLVGVILLGFFLIWLFLGRPSPFPFILGVTPLGDPNSLLGDVLPTIIARLIERIGAVVIGIFIIQLMMGFVRYYFRLADHLSMLANLLRLTEGKVENVAALGAVFLPVSIDFGRVPRSPFESVLRSVVDTLKEAVGKLPPR